MLPPLKPLQDREISSSQPNWFRRLKTADPGTTKELAKWPSSHQYAYTIGDVVKEKALDLRTGQLTDLWFAHPNVYAEDPKARITRKVFISFKIKRLSDIDNVKEQFRIKFHIYFNWLLTKDEYDSFYQTKKAGEIYNWEPKWYPRIEFLNQIEAVEPFPRWEEYPEEGKFRLSKFKDFGKLLYDDDSRMFDPTKAYFVRGKFDVEMVLAEELELHAFPFDCQDLGVVMRENSTDVKVIFLPELRRKHFGSVDPRYSVIDEWDMEAARIELGLTNAGSSRSSTTYPMIILRLKMKRRWGSTMWNVCFLMSCIEMLALSTFSIDPVLNPGDRLGLGFTLVLTAVAFLFVVKKSLPPVSYLTFLDKYILSGNIFLIATNLETAILAAANFDSYAYIDDIFLWGCSAYLIAYHFLFVWYAVTLRKEETTKLIMDSDEIENEVTANRPALEFDIRYFERQGNEGRLLAFRATQKKSVD